MSEPILYERHAKALRRLPFDRCGAAGSERAGRADRRLSTQPLPRCRDGHLLARAGRRRFRRQAVRRVSSTCSMPLGPRVHAVLETSHGRLGDRHIDLRRGDIDLPVLMSHFCDFEDLLLNDGCTGVAVVSADAADRSSTGRTQTVVRLCSRPASRFAASCASTACRSIHETASDRRSRPPAPQSAGPRGRVPPVGNAARRRRFRLGLERRERPGGVVIRNLPNLRNNQCHVIRRLGRSAKSPQVFHE